MPMTTIVAFPEKFAEDYDIARGLPTGDNLGSCGRYRLYRCNEEELLEWLSDAEHYSDCASEGWDFGTRGEQLGMASSARATAKRARIALETLRSP